MAARMPMIATTINNSINVKPFSPCLGMMPLLCEMAALLVVKITSRRHNESPLLNACPAGVGRIGRRGVRRPEVRSQKPTPEAGNSSLLPEGPLNRIRHPRVTPIHLPLCLGHGLEFMRHPAQSVRQPCRRISSASVTVRKKRRPSALRPILSNGLPFSDLVIQSTQLLHLPEIECQGENAGKIMVEMPSDSNGGERAVLCRA